MRIFRHALVPDLTPGFLFTVDDPCSVIGGGDTPWPHDCRKTTLCDHGVIGEPTQCAEGMVSNANGVCVSMDSPAACSPGECLITIFFKV